MREAEAMQFRSPTDLGSSNTPAVRDVTRLLLCCDDQLFGAALHALVRQYDDLYLVSGCVAVSAAPQWAVQTTPDVALLVAPRLLMDCVEPLAGHTKVIVMTDECTVAEALQTVTLGAHAVLTPRPEERELIAAIRLVAHTRLHILPTSIRQHLADLPGGPRSTVPAGLTSLTSREHEVLKLIAEGLSNQEIAERLAVRPVTVSSHVYHLLRKLEVHSRSQAVSAAYGAGLFRAADAREDA